MENTYILPQHICAEKEIYSLLKRNNCFLIVEGDKGIGKSYVIERVLASYSENASVISIDLSSDWSRQTLLLEITRELLQLDFSKLLALLSESDKKDLNRQILENANKEDDYLIALKQKLLYCSKENNALLAKANNLCQSQIAAIKKINSDTSDIYELQVKIYFLYYNQQKTLFRFDLAEEFVDKGLLLEHYCHDNELIGKMYWCKGLCLKERGIKPGFLNFMLKGIKKYPDAMYLKICYLSNYASSNFKIDLNKSYKALAVGIQLAQKAQFIDLEVWLSNNQIICNLTKKDFSEACLKQIIAIREKADRYELLSDISRAYNNEGIWHFASGNTNEALDCFQHALNIFDESVTDQQKFLFRTNKIVLLWKENKNIRDDLNILYDWLKDNYGIMESKLNKTSNLRKENNYAAILSLYRVSYITGQNWFVQKLTEWFKYPVFDSIKNNPINVFEPGKDLLDKAFLVKNEIFILF